jgi:MFS family permease
LLFIGFGFANPSLQSLISRTAPDSMRGGAMGIAQSANSLGRILGPAWAGFAFASIGVAWPFFSGTAILVPIVLVTLILARQISRTKQE